MHAFWDPKDAHVRLPNARRIEQICRNEEAASRQYKIALKPNLVEPCSDLHTSPLPFGCAPSFISDITTSQLFLLVRRCVSLKNSLETQRDRTHRSSENATTSAMVSPNLPKPKAPYGHRDQTTLSKGHAMLRFDRQIPPSESQTKSTTWASRSNCLKQGPCHAALRSSDFPVRVRSPPIFFPGGPPPFNAPRASTQPAIKRLMHRNWATITHIEPASKQNCLERSHATLASSGSVCLKRCHHATLPTTGLAKHIILHSSRLPQILQSANVRHQLTRKLKSRTPTLYGHLHRPV